MSISRKGKEFSRKVKLDCWDRAGGCCEKCGRKLHPGDKYRFDHIISIEMGGGNGDDNVQLLCIACDAPKTADDARKHAKSRRIRSKHIGADRPKKKIPYRRFDGSGVWPR